jgi:hypothetical protein
VQKPVTTTDFYHHQTSNYENMNFSQRPSQPQYRPPPVQPETPSAEWVNNQLHRGYAHPWNPDTPTNGHNNGHFDVPRGYFDKYRHEIENLRRSRESLHHQHAQVCE